MVTRICVAAVAVCAASLLACSDGGGGGGGGGDGSEAFLASVQGTWVGCVTRDGFDVQSVNVIADHTSTQSALAYDSGDGSCTGQAWAYDHGVATFTVGNEIAATLEGRSVTARAIDAASPGETFYTIAWVDGAADPDVLYEGDDSADPERDGTTAARRPTVLETPGHRAGAPPEIFGFVSAVQGVWAACVNEGGGATDEREVMTISGLAFEVAGSVHSTTDATCSGTVTEEFGGAGDVTVGPVVAATLSGSPVSGAHAIDVTFSGAPAYYTIMWVDTSPEPDVLYTGDDRADPARDGAAPDRRPDVLQAWKPRLKTAP